MSFQVTSDGEVAQTPERSTGEKDRAVPIAKARPRPRPSRALPTDRMKFEVQVNALKAIVIQSDMGKNAVGADDIAPRLGVTSSTAGLNNAFFLESGLVERESKGRYKPTSETIKFAQQHSFQGDNAGAALAPALRNTWFFKEVAKEPAPRERMIEVLAYAAGTTKDRQVQLGALLSWLEYARLIAVADDGTVHAVSDQDGDVRMTEGRSEEPGISTPDESQAESSGPVPTKKGGAVPATGGDPASGHVPPLLSFAFDFALTTDDIAKLSPEQIQSLFQAVGAVMAIKGALAGHG